MNVFTNETTFTAQLDRAKKMRMIGLVCLILALGAALYFQFFNPNATWIVLLSYPFLFVGFPLWTVGNNRLRVLRTANRADQLITNELKGFNDKYTLHHYPSVDGQMIKHLLIAPAGLLVIESRETTGAVTCNDDKWKSKTGTLERFAGVATPVGDVTGDLMAECKAAQTLIDNLNKPDVAIKGLVVFTKTADIEVNGSTFAAVPIAELRDAVREILYDMEPEREERSSGKLILTSEDRRKLNAELAPPKPVVAPKPAPVRNQG